VSGDFTIRAVFQDVGLNLLFDISFYFCFFLISASANDSAKILKGITNILNECYFLWKSRVCFSDSVWWSAFFYNFTNKM